MASYAPRAQMLATTGDLNPPYYEAAVAIGVDVLPHPDLLVRQVVISQLHQDMWTNIADTTSFARILDQL